MTTHTPRARVIEPHTPTPAQRARQLAQRLSRLLSVNGHADPTVPDAETVEWPSVPPPPGEDEILPRFPYVRHGYECAAVDEYVTGLERELAELDRTLAELRDRLESDGVASEIKRLGEETSSVLIAAHETREEMLRQAREEAERRLAEASSQASAIISQQETQARQLQERNDGLRRERDRLLDQVRSISSSLAQIAESAREPQ